MKMLELINKKYEPMLALPIYGKKIERLVDKGLFFCACYMLNPAEAVGK